MVIEAHHPHCHLFPFIDRHPGVIRRFQVLTVTDKPVDPACGLIPVQMNVGIRVPVWAALQSNASAIVIFVRIVCPTECMAAATDSVMVFQEVSPLFFVLMIQEKRIDCQPTVRIIAAPRKISIDFIFRDESFVLIPVKTIPRRVVLIGFRKLLEQSRYFIRLIKVHPHQVFIFDVGFSQRGQSLIEIGQKIRIIQQACQPVCQFRETAPEDFYILKDCFGNAICQVALHIGQCLRVFLQSILPCSIQNRLRSILTLPEQFMDTIAHILPRQKRIDKRAALCRAAYCNTQP